MPTKKIIVGRSYRGDSVLSRKAENHDVRMQAVYEHLYQDRYRFKTNEVANAEALIVKNLGEMGLMPAFLHGQQVMDMGTGRQSVAFSRLGAKTVFHFDISPVPVEALTGLAAEEPRFANIRSQRVDICLPADLDVPGGLDLVYMVGILQHLHNPGQAMVNILPVVNPGGYVYFRNYRSGTLNMLVVDFLRRLVPRDAGEAFANQFAYRYPGFLLHHDNTHQNVLARFYTSLYDHLFVPVLNLYNPRQLDGFFREAGFEPVIDYCGPIYNHDNDMVLGGTGISLYYQRRRHGAAELPPFPRPVDQLAGLDYAEPFIRRTVELMTIMLERADRLSLSQILNFAIDAYWAPFGHALYTFYNAAKVAPDREIAATGHTAHCQLHKLLMLLTAS